MSNPKLRPETIASGCDEYYRRLSPRLGFHAALLADRIIVAALPHGDRGGDFVARCEVGGVHGMTLGEVFEAITRRMDLELTANGYAADLGASCSLCGRTGMAR